MCDQSSDGKVSLPHASPCDEGMATQSRCPLSLSVCFPLTLATRRSNSPLFSSWWVDMNLCMEYGNRVLFLFLEMVVLAAPSACSLPRTPTWLGTQQRLTALLALCSSMRRSCLFATIGCLEYKCSIIASELVESQQMTYVISFKFKRCSRASRIAVSWAVNIVDTKGYVYGYIFTVTKNCKRNVIPFKIFLSFVYAGSNENRHLNTCHPLSIARLHCQALWGRRTNRPHLSLSTLK